jgi:hypothetical protein
MRLGAATQTLTVAMGEMRSELVNIHQKAKSNGSEQHCASGWPR